MFAFIGGGLIYLMSVSNQRASLQSLADRAAVASAHELIVSIATGARVTSVAEAFVRASDLDSVDKTTATVIDGGHAVTVSKEAPTRTFFAGPTSNVTQLTAEAAAEVSGGGYVCMIGL